MKTGQSRRMTITLITLALLLPVHAWAENQYGDQYFGVLIAQNDKYKRKHSNHDDQYRLKKHHNQNEKHYRKENIHSSHMSLKESAFRAQGHVKGRILSARRYQKGGRSYHRVKILTPDGVVRVILVDPETGNMN